MYRSAAVLISFLVLFSTTAILGCDTVDPVAADASDSEDWMSGDDAASLIDQIAGMNVEPLSDDETQGLIWMREEEKLARDVYAALYAQWKRPIFSNIARSEQTHMDAVLALLRKYNIPDPVEGRVAGVFTDQTLQDLYTSLVQRGTRSMTEALTVGCLVEELDIADLQKHVAVTDNADILLVFNNLTKGSRNHLRAFNRNVVAAGVTYTPQYITQEQYNAIVNSPMERGRAR